MRNKMGGFAIYLLWLSTDCFEMGVVWEGAGTDGFGPGWKLLLDHKERDTPFCLLRINTYSLTFRFTLVEG